MIQEQWQRLRHWTLAICQHTFLSLCDLCPLRLKPSEIVFGVLEFSEYFETMIHSLAQLFGDLVFKLIRTTQSRNIDTTQWAGMLVLFFNEPQRTTHNQEGRMNDDEYDQNWF